MVCFPQVLCKEKDRRPPDIVVHKILIASDLSLRNQNGETILFKAISCDYSESLIRALFKYGIDIAARDRKGRTAHDYAAYLKQTKYFGVLDDYVISLVKEGRVDLLEALLLQGYDHILDVTDSRGFNIYQIVKEKGLSGKDNMNQFLKGILSAQVVSPNCFFLLGKPKRIDTFLYKHFARAGNS